MTAQVSSNAPANSASTREARSSETLSHDVSDEKLEKILDAALTRLELREEQLKKAAALIESQTEAIRLLEERDVIRLKNLDALERALAAEELAKMGERERAELADERVKSLEQKLGKANKRTKAAAVVGFIGGLFLKALLPF